MNRLAPLLVPLAAFLSACARSSASPAPAPPATRPVEAVVIISADGLRPDVLLRGEAPTVRHLMRTGSFTMWARTVDLAWTVPSHVSMLTGVSPDEHGMWDNLDYGPLDEASRPKVPTVFDLAKAAGRTTALCVGKAKLQALARPGSLDWSYAPAAFADAIPVAEQAARIIRDHAPDLLVIHLPDADGFGHTIGWGSAEQVGGVARIDAAVAIVLKALRDRGTLDRTAILFTADHGGAGFFHTANDPRSQTIPWILAGPGIRANHDLTQDYYLKVNTTDTFATAMHLLGVAVPHKVQGKVVRQALIGPATTPGSLMYDVAGETPATPAP